MNVVTTPPTCDLERFWNLESLGISEGNVETTESALELYKQKQITFKDGRYVARLPWKPDHKPLPTNFEITKRRTESTIRRLSKQPSLLKKYGEIIADQEKRGFVERVPEQEVQDKNVHYIPHHAVRKESETTPIRIVYDCSCKTSREQPSLNDCLQSTPPELNGLTDILIRFRQYKYGVVTDIEKAFLHVGLHKNDRDFTRFHWLSNPQDPNSVLQTYRFRAILFGATCSPFILNTAIQKHLDENTHNWVSECLKRDLYVDNILSSFPQEETVLRYFKETRALMSSAAYNLRSWTSNSEYLRQVAADVGVLDINTITKVLELKWNVISDEMLFSERPVTVCATSTKREILKQTSRIYDPLGILSPITVRAKILLQEIWKRKLNWDVPLPSDLHEKWTCLAGDLNLACKTKVQRYYFRNGPPEEASDVKTLHVFVDASMSAYSATAYICKGNQAMLVMAKNRVAPLKKITLPRLELMAAVIGVRMANTIQQTLSCRETVFWSDSQIVLHWIASTKPLNRFVQNRVQEFMP